MADCDEFIRKWVTIYGQCQLLFTGNVIYFREIPFFKQKFPFSTSNSNFFLFILFYKISLDKIRKMCGRFRF